MVLLSFVAASIAFFSANAFAEKKSSYEFCVCSWNREIQLYQLEYIYKPNDYSEADRVLLTSGWGWRSSASCKAEMQEFPQCKKQTCDPRDPPPSRRARTIYATSYTLLKKRPVGSGELGRNEKCAINMHQGIVVEVMEAAQGNHTRVRLRDAVPGCEFEVGSTAYVFNGHIAL